MKLLLFLIRYLSFLLKSRKHITPDSVFIAKFLDIIKESKFLENSDSIKIESLRDLLSKSKKKIEILDFGAGSNINRSRFRKVGDIIRNSAKEKKFGNLLYNIVNEYKPKTILELGTSLGISTSYLASANIKANVTTLEGCPQTAKIAKENFNKLNCKNIRLVLGDFDKTLERELTNLNSIDLTFIDGNHQKESTIRYFKNILDYSHENTIFILDDIYWSQGMKEAWDIIKNHEKVSCSIDIFFIGIILIRKEINKEHLIVHF